MGQHGDVPARLEDARAGQPEVDPIDRRDRVEGVSVRPHLAAAEHPLDFIPEQKRRFTDRREVAVDEGVDDELLCWRRNARVEVDVRVS